MKFQKTVHCYNCGEPKLCQSYICGMLNLFFKYKYWVAFGFFGLWMLFFDSNNLFYRISVADEISDLEKSIQMHKVEITALQKQKSEILGNHRNLEKFARERYLMKKDNEDLFVIDRDTVSGD